MTDAAPALKEIFNAERLAHIADAMLAVYPAFDHRGFLQRASHHLAERSLMQRLAQVSDSLHQVLPGSYEHSLELLYALAPRLNSRFVCIFLPHFVASHGAHDFARSMAALKFFTGFGSSEFAVRPFLVSHQHATLEHMQDWALDPDEHVRRLASEGSRPRLPWSFRLEQLQADPQLAAPILERLKNDPSLYVRKSVANHLNDITKDHPQWVLERLQGWPLEQPHSAWIARHALRSLIKQGDRQALTLIGAGARAEVEVHGFAVAPSALHLGQTLSLSLQLLSTHPEPQRLVVDYAIDYVKASGATASKVFKLKTFTLPGHGRQTLARQQPIREFTTRRHYPGRHAVHLLVNGERLASSHFDLLLP
ncbi:DNA alkylation repair protein [Pseudomonas sp. Fl5BN2]|uniref:DNA alkylation repair protein n=1 Tax=unclassified Pseudomonas TaxID=196821 RepID=UPI0013769212|nr:MULTISPECIES: DNA alkylation repair protein [unclassified Pseudomonas]NBF04915.1 DNA alkylation repair protein [Pseudomonas sp. Fl5BN2]NBF09173.1 DNA alkylation repair protein [Pseudomonas sp. Fl4BN1]